MRKLWRSCWILFGCIQACSQEQGQEREQSVQSPVPDGAFAMVGAKALPLVLLSERYAADRLKEAHLLTQSALFGTESVSNSLHSFQAIDRGVLARKYLQDLEVRTLRDTPISEKELQDQRALDWMLYDRPRAVRTAIILIPVAHLAPQEEEYLLALEIRDATAGALNIDSFVYQARAVETELSLVIQARPPVAEDGRVVPMLPQDKQFETLDLDFAKAATALQVPGELSDVVATRDGFYLIFCLEIVPALRLDGEEVRAELTRSIAAGRVSRLVSEMKTERRVPISRQRDDISSLLQNVRRHE